MVAKIIDLLREADEIQRRCALLLELPETLPCDQREAIKIIISNVTHFSNTIIELADFLESECDTEE